MNEPRPKNHLIAASKLYPNAWRKVGEMRAGSGIDLPKWPEWCYLPIAGWYAIVSADAGVPRLDHHHLKLVGNIGRLAALGTWRMTQGIYRFDPDLLAALLDTPLTGDLPADLFYRLPEWCVYIETPGHHWLESTLHGFFAHLEWDINTGRPELRLLMDSETALLPIPVHIGQWSLDEAIQRTTAEAKRQAIDQGASAMAARIPAQADFSIDGLISILLYLCSENAEIGDGTQRPANPMPKKTRHGWKLFPPDKTRQWDVGVRIGSALRRSQSRATTAPSDGTHASPRPHIRRAHWHTYLVGAGRTERRLKWLPPMAVNIDDPDALPVTIKPVRD